MIGKPAPPQPGEKQANHDLFRLFDTLKKGPSVYEVFHHLVSEPFCLPLSEIRQLTPFVVRYVYFWKKEDDMFNMDRKVTPEMVYAKQLRQEGLDEEEVFKRVRTLAKVLAEKRERGQMAKRIQSNERVEFPQEMMTWGMSRGKVR